jgi:hypothetical protein
MMIHRLVSPSLGLLIHDDAPPTDAEWDPWLSTIRNPRDGFSILVTTDGGAPSRAQQARFGAELRGKIVPTSVVTDRALARFVVSAMSFINRGVRGFAPTEIDAALDWLRADAPSRAALDAELRAIQAANAGKLRTLDRVAQHVAGR